MQHVRCWGWGWGEGLGVWQKVQYHSKTSLYDTTLVPLTEQDFLSVEEGEGDFLPITPPTAVSPLLPKLFVSFRCHTRTQWGLDYFSHESPCTAWDRTEVPDWIKMLQIMLHVADCLSHCHHNLNLR